MAAAQDSGWHIILINLAKLLFFIGLAHLPLTLFAYFSGWEVFLSFVATNAMLLLFGLAFLFKEPGGITHKHAMTISALVWLLIPLASSIPFALYGLPLTDAYFEAMSGWTTTGFSFIADPAALPAALILYRSYIQWIGGLGVVVFALLIFKSRFTPALFRTEGTESFQHTVAQTVKNAWVAYAAFTLAGAVLLVMAGIAPFAALNLAMSAIATGGFIPTASIAAIPLAAKLTLAAIMLVGATSLALLHDSLRLRLHRLLANNEFQLLTACAALGTVLVAANGVLLVDALFHAVSALTGTGFATADVLSWGAPAVLLLMLLMLIGGSSGSTSGALRIWRVMVLAKSVYSAVKGVFLPRFAVVKTKAGAKTLTDQEIIEVSNYFFIYLLFAALAAFGLMLSGLDFASAAFTALSAQGNVGIAPVIGWYELSDGPKLLLAFSMWIGRLQVFPALILAAYLLSNRRLSA
ncbi:MAG: TrkH family potassium uptake protein [Candidatus Aenigmarchaeota archaeon]|nr:TrkH family potassium uptake protein [Candidatus Aenigmarchaeota archaeon]